MSLRVRKASQIITWIELSLGFFLIAYALSLLPMEISEKWLSLIILIVASAFAYHIKVEFPFARISQAYSVNFLAVMVLGSWIGSLVAATGVTLGDGLFRRKRWYAIGVNAAVQFLATYLTGRVYFMLGGLGTISGVDVLRTERFLVSPDVSIFLPLIAAAVVHTLTNVSLLIPAMLGEGKVIPQQTLLKLTQWDLISTLFFTPLSFYIFLIYGKTAGWSLLPPLLFLLVCWVLVQRSLDLNLAKSKLDLTVARLEKITQISKAVNAAGLNPEEILDIVLINGMMVCGAPAAAIRLFDPSPRGEVCELVRPNAERWMRFFGSQSFQNIVDHVVSTGSSLLIDEFRVDNIGEWFSSALIDEHGLGSFLAFPILRERRVEGLLFFAGDRPRMFTQTHIETLEYLSGEIAIAIRNARIHHEISVQYARKEEEIRLAEKVQKHILPNPYQAPNVRIRGAITPARNLSGDFFDIIELDGNRVAFAMGDVSGKGVPASLTMMAIVNSIRVLAHKVKRPDEMLSLLNESLYESEARIDDFFQYSTGFFAILDLRTLRMSYSIAGSEKPLWWHARERFLSQLDGEGLPLGMFSNTKYSVEKVTLEPGDAIVFFTDGVTDAVDPHGNRYGRQTFAHSVEKNCLRNDGNLLQAIGDDIKAFKGEADPVDDIAIMTVEITGPPLGEKGIEESCSAQSSKAASGLTETTLFRS